MDDAGRFIAYTSNATNLVPTAVGSGYQAYIYDGFWGVTSECVSQALDGGPANAWVAAVAISGEDGRFVVMLGAASNLVSDDTNGVEDIFVRDRWTNTTTRVSVASDGRQASAPSRDGAISSDGRFVAFTSQAAELATGGVAGGVFLHDLWTKQTIAPRTSGGGTPDAGGFAGVAAPALSTHLVDIAGIRVTNRISLVYHSDAANIAPGDTNAASDVFTRIVTVP